MIYLLYVVHVLVCVFLILVVLLQQGKGADLSVFGGGTTQTAFGARGATTLLHKLTVASFVIFIAHHRVDRDPEEQRRSRRHGDGGREAAQTAPASTPASKTPASRLRLRSPRRPSGGAHAGSAGRSGPRRAGAPRRQDARGRRE